MIAQWQKWSVILAAQRKSVKKPNKSFNSKSGATLHHKRIKSQQMNSDPKLFHSKRFWMRTKLLTKIVKTPNLSLTNHWVPTLLPSVRGACMIRMINLLSLLKMSCKRKLTCWEKWSKRKKLFPKSRRKMKHMHANFNKNSMSKKWLKRLSNFPSRKWTMRTTKLSN